MISENFKPLAQNNVFIKSLVRKKLDHIKFKTEQIKTAHTKTRNELESAGTRWNKLGLPRTRLTQQQTSRAIPSPNRIKH